MLTDIFAYRYANVPIWQAVGEPERRLLVQIFRILKEQLFQYYLNDGKESPEMKAVWSELQSRLSMELGVASLSPLTYGYYTPTKHWMSGSWPLVQVCETWTSRELGAGQLPDTYIKERLSLVELGFRKKEEMVTRSNADLSKNVSVWEDQTMRKTSGPRLPGSPVDFLRAANAALNATFASAVHELNTRFRQASCGLHYHNGFIQLSRDALVLTKVEQPFWNLVAGPKWKNVDVEMKEAIDSRDAGGRDPAFDAARALESVIKIISDEKGLTRGSERGAHAYIDNISKAGFIEPWEAESMKLFFGKVRNPFGHGAGSSQMATLSGQQTNWAIETCMSWIKSLIQRM